MDIGTFLLMQSPSARPSEEIYARGSSRRRPPRALGFRNVWLGEHHFSTYGYLSRPLQLATYIAAKTTRLRVGTAVIVVPLHHPLLIAEEIATLDILSAAGAPTSASAAAISTTSSSASALQLDTSGERWNESIDIIMKAFEGKPFSYEGKFFKMPETSSSRSRCRSRIRRSGSWRKARMRSRRRAKRGFNVLTGGFGVSVERLAEFGKIFEKVVDEVKPPRQPLVGVQRAVYVTKDEADAREAAEHARWNMRVTLSLRNHYERVESGKAIAVPGKTEPTIDELLDRYLVIGTPETCIRQIKRMQDVVGITHFNCSFWIGDLDQARVLQLDGALPEEVMPAFV